MAFPGISVLSLHFGIVFCPWRSHGFMKIPCLSEHCPRRFGIWPHQPIRKRLLTACQFQGRFETVQYHIVHPCKVQILLGNIFESVLLKADKAEAGGCQDLRQSMFEIWEWKVDFGCYQLWSIHGSSVFCSSTLFLADTISTCCLSGLKTWSWIAVSLLFWKISITSLSSLTGLRSWHPASGWCR